MISLLSMLWMVSLVFVGCETEERYSLDDTAFAEVDCSSVSYANVGEPFMIQYCLGCHGGMSSNRQGAPTDVMLDNLDNILLHADTVREEILLETMPPSGGVNSDTIALFVAWLDCEVEQ